ncbi:MAG: hypothetical protein GY699_07010 [Desulfobacteraceae bacterium]|nr:hypothetical protein [Desulfobacteraceae bacterium]
MTIIILAVVGAFILLDFTIIGFIPEKFGIWGSLRKENLTKLIEDSVQFSIRTDITGKYIDSMINNRVAYKSVILTPKYILVKNTYLTYLMKIKVNSVDSYEIKNELIGSRIKLNLKIQGSTNIFEFSTKNSKQWIQKLEKMNIFVKQTAD